MDVRGAQNDRDYGLTAASSTVSRLPLSDILNRGGDTYGLRIGVIKAKVSIGKYFAHCHQ
jgi:hypothetical protein